MRQRNYLFDLNPYTERRVRRTSTGMPEEVKAALRRLKLAIDAIPREEWRRRARRWRELNRSVRSL